MTDKDNEKIILGNIESTHLLKPKTKAIYLKRLRIITSEFWEGRKSLMWIINHPTEFKQELLKYGASKEGRVYDSLSSGTLAQFIVPIISIILAHREIQEDYPDLLDQWKQIKNEIEGPSINRKVIHQPNDRQREGFVPWDQILKIRDQLPVRTHDDDETKLLVYLYTEIPPIRSDFDCMKVYQETPTHNGDLTNYLVLGQVNRIYLNNYKTSKKYGTIEIPLTPPLIERINQSLKKHPRDFLFQKQDGSCYTHTSWNASANKRLKRVFGQGFSLTTFRHSYLSREELRTLPLEERLRISSIMGHQLRRQTDYDISQVP